MKRVRVFSVKFPLYCFYLGKYCSLVLWKLKENEHIEIEKDKTHTYHYCPCHTFKYCSYVDKTQVNTSSFDFFLKFLLSYLLRCYEIFPLHCPKPTSLHQTRYFHLNVWVCHEHHHFLGHPGLNFGVLSYFSIPCQTLSTLTSK